jgi:hypothetical protein
MGKPRTIITAQLLIEKFSHLEPRMMIFILGGFFKENDPAYFDERLEELDSYPDDPGKDGLKEIWEHLRSAYLKMSTMERKRVARDLIFAIAEHLTKTQI